MNEEDYQKKIKDIDIKQEELQHQYNIDRTNLEEEHDQVTNRIESKIEENYQDTNEYRTSIQPVLDEVDFVTKDVDSSIKDNNKYSINKINDIHQDNLSFFNSRIDSLEEQKDNSDKLFLDQDDLIIENFHKNRNNLDDQLDDLNQKFDGDDIS